MHLEEDFWEDYLTWRSDFTQRNCRSPGVPAKEARRICQVLRQGKRAAAVRILQAEIKIHRTSEAKPEPGKCVGSLHLLIQHPRRQRPTQRERAKEICRSVRERGATNGWADRWYQHQDTMVEVTLCHRTKALWWFLLRLNFPAGLGFTGEAGHWERTVEGKVWMRGSGDRDGLILHGVEAGCGRAWQACAGLEPPLSAGLVLAVLFPRFRSGQGSSAPARTRVTWIRSVIIPLCQFPPFKTRGLNLGQAGPSGPWERTLSLSLTNWYLH